MPKTLPIEIEVENYKDDDIDKRRKAWKITSIKHNNVELLHSRYMHPQASVYADFVSKLSAVLSAPKEQLRITWNEEIKDNALIVYPWEFELSRRQPDEID